MMNAELLVKRFRQFLLWMTVIGCIGVIAELILTGHYKEPMQFVPFVLCGLGIVLALVVIARPSRTSLMALRGLMILMVLGGLLGSIEHIQGNLELAREVNAAKANAAPIQTALTGADPALAPGALGITALLALAATYYHPALKEESVTTSVAKA